MKTQLVAASVICAMSGAVSAGGLDRSNTPVDIIFEDGNYAEIAFGYLNPDVDGKDTLGFGTGSVADSYTNLRGGVKFEINERLDFAVIYDQPYGSDIKYPSSSPVIGMTKAKANTDALTVLFKYNVNDRFSVYGGPRVLRADGKITLAGGAYGPLSGYQVKFKKSTSFGAVAGMAYEIPDIAFRAALTYHSRTKLDFETRETFPAGFPNPLVPGGVELNTGETKTKTPQSVELKLQSGIAQNTLLFGSVRWSEWSDFILAPQLLGRSLTDLDDSWTFELGLGRKFTEKFSGSVTFGYEPKDDDKQVSPLAPTNGYYSIGLGGKYDIDQNWSVSAGAKYYIIGDAEPAIGSPKTTLAKTKNNDAFALGMKIGYRW